MRPSDLKTGDFSVYGLGLDDANGMMPARGVCMPREPICYSVPVIAQPIVFNEATTTDQRLDRKQTL
jgi:hypothetical protein